MSKPIKILYIPTLNMGTIFWRIESYAQALVGFKKRCAVNVAYLLDPYSNYAWDSMILNGDEQAEHMQQKLVAACSFYDVIIFQRIQNVQALALLDKYKEDYPNVRFVVELDDAIGDAQPGNPHASKMQHTLSAKHVEMSDAVITSTKYLSKSITEMFPDKKVHIAPNCINRSLWKNRTLPFKKNEFRIGYVAGGSHDEDLSIAYNGILPLLNEDNNIKFVIRYGGFRPDWLEKHPKIDFKTVSWDVWDYPKKLAKLRCNLALAPLRDTNMNRCKSNIKWLEWSYLNVPVIASNVEPYVGCPRIRLVDNNQVDWENMIRACYEIFKNPGTSMGHNFLKNDCLSRYNLKEECRKLLDFLGKL